MYNPPYPTEERCCQGTIPRPAALYLYIKRDYVCTWYRVKHSRLL